MRNRNLKAKIRRIEAENERLDLENESLVIEKERLVVENGIRMETPTQGSHDQAAHTPESYTGKYILAFLKIVEAYIMACSLICFF